MWNVRSPANGVGRGGPVCGTEFMGRGSIKGLCSHPPGIPGVVIPLNTYLSSPFSKHQFWIQSCCLRDIEPYGHFPPSIMFGGNAILRRDSGAVGVGVANGESG